MMTNKQYLLYIQKATKEILAIKHLFNQQEGLRFDFSDIIIQVSKKYNIPFNVLDRIVNWARRENENLKDFIKVRDILENSLLSKKEVINLANENYITILHIGDSLYVRKSIIDFLIKLNEEKNDKR